MKKLKYHPIQTSIASYTDHILGDEVIIELHLEIFDSKKGEDRKETSRCYINEKDFKEWIKKHNFEVEDDERIHLSSFVEKVLGIQDYEISQNRYINYICDEHETAAAEAWEVLEEIIEHMEDTSDLIKRARKAKNGLSVID